MEQLIAYLCSLHPLSDSLIKHLVKIIQVKEVRKMDFLLEAGFVSRHIYFVKRGLLRCYYLKDKIEVTSWILKEGDVVVSVHSFYDQVESFENIQALEDTEVFYISHEALEEIYELYPEFNFVGRVLTIKYLKFWSMQLYNIRMRTARERFDQLMENDPELLLRVQQRYLASYLDMLPETLSRIKRSASN